MAQKFLQIQPCRLAGGGCTATATSIILETFAYPDGTAIVTADLGTTCWATIEPNTSREEIVSFTGVTQNVDGTATLTGCTRGLKFGTPYTADANLRKAHAGGVAFVVSNNPQLYENLISFDNDETVTGEFTFPAGGTAKAPKSGTAYTAPTDDLEYTSKKFVVDVASGVGVSYNKIVVAGTGGEDIVAGQVVYLKTSDQEWYLADASTAATAENILYGIAQGAGSNGAAIAGGVLIQGKDENQTGLTAGKQFLSDTAGGLSATTGTVEVTMGIAEDATSIIFKPLFDQQLTEDQKDALVGTSGTPGATNKFVTNDDATTAKTASKIARRDSNGDVLVATTPSTTDSATSKDYVDTALALKPNMTQVLGVDTGATYYNYIIPIVGDAAATVIGWGKVGTATITAVTASSGMGGLTSVTTGTTAVSYLYTGFGFAKGVGTGRNFSVKFLASFPNGAATQTHTFSIGANPGIGANAISLMYNPATQKMEFYTSDADSATTTDLSANVVHSTVYLFEIIYTYGTSVVLKVDGTVRATHDTVANIPAIATVTYLFVGRSAGSTSSVDSVGVSPITVSYQLV